MSKFMPRGLMPLKDEAGGKIQQDSEGSLGIPEGYIMTITAVWSANQLTVTCQGGDKWDRNIDTSWKLSWAHVNVRQSYLLKSLIPGCYRLRCAPQNSYDEVLTLGPLKRWVSPNDPIRVVTRPNWLLSFKEEEVWTRIPGMCTQRKTVWGHSREGALCKASREASEETKPADTLFLDFWLPELWDSKPLWLKPLTLPYFVTAALDRQYTNLNPHHGPAFLFPLLLGYFLHTVSLISLLAPELAPLTCYPPYRQHTHTGYKPFFHYSIWVIDTWPSFLILQSRCQHTSGLIYFHDPSFSCSFPLANNPWSSNPTTCNFCYDGSSSLSLSGWKWHYRGCSSSRWPFRVELLYVVASVAWA